MVSDPTSPTMPPPPPPKPSFFDEMRAALPEAHRVSLDQAYLAGQLAQEKIDEATSSPEAKQISDAIDRVRAIVDEVSGKFDVLPAPLSAILKEAKSIVDLADDALEHVGL